jgi:MoaA/NifB/PqqE/SkfB family radical SAM enzyme/metal-sulfur cluster biosynthetic enzyme
VSGFDRAPFLVIWETTRACALACVHCRAEAVPHRSAGELTTQEGRRLIDAVAAFGTPPPLMVLTGGDPLRRPDIVDLVAYGTERGITMSLTPSATGAVTTARLAALRDAGLARLAVSLDGAEAATHDAFRRVRGSYRHTLAIVERARALGLPLQINTTVCRRTVSGLPALAEQIVEYGAVLWALFFLIPVGRARAEDALDAREVEHVLAWAADLASRVPFGIKTTEAPHYHRVLARRGAPAAGQAPHRAGRAVTDGNGIVFVDHLGSICPSGFLPLARGNVRTDDLGRVYRDDPVFQALRDPLLLEGRCGACEYRDRCGGSRARAWAATGNAFAGDPGCAWHPGEARAVAAIAGGSDGAPAPTKAQVIDALRTVFDPELGMSIVDLGLVYDVQITNGHVRITMTLTAPGCPIHDVMPGWVSMAVKKVPGVEIVEVALTFDPAWTPERIQRPSAR